MIKEIYRGDFYPHEKVAPKHEEYTESMRKLESEEEYWEKELSADAFARLREALLDNYIKTAAYETEEAFIYGFTTGVKLMIEILK